MDKKAFLLLVLVCSVFPAAAQHTHEGHVHEGHARNEIGLGVSAAYELGHRAWAPAFHLHYFRTLSPHSRWALGGGMEYLSGDENHVEIGAGVRFEPLPRLHLTIVPGVSFAGGAHFSVHAEVTYEILHLGRFHLGPVAGYAWSRGHSHMSIGLHGAISF